MLLKKLAALHPFRQLSHSHLAPSNTVHTTHTRNQTPCRPGTHLRRKSWYVSSRSSLITLFTAERSWWSGMVQPLWWV